MKYHELMTSISKGEVRSAYLFSGEEDFLKEEALKKIISSQVKPGFRSFDLDILHGDDISFQTLRSCAETLPFGSVRRVVVLRNLEGLSQSSRRKLLSWLESPPPRTCLILVAAKVDFKEGFYRELASKTESVVFWRLFDHQIPKWAVKYLKEKGLAIEEEALYVLYALVGNDLFSLTNELEKVSTYLGQGGKIGVEGIRSVVGSHRIDSVFDLNLALGMGELEAALKVIGNLLDWGETPNRILAMVSRHLFILKRLKAPKYRDASLEELARKLRIPKLYLKDYIRQVERLSGEDIDQGLKVVYQTEVTLKSRPVSERLLLELMATAICRPELVPFQQDHTEN